MAVTCSLLQLQSALETTWPRLGRYEGRVGFSGKLDTALSVIYLQGNTEDKVSGWTDRQIYPPVCSLKLPSPEVVLDSDLSA